MEENLFQFSSFLSSITALCTFSIDKKFFTLSGNGPYLCLYDFQNGILLDNIFLFPSTIYGIRKIEKEKADLIFFLVFGEKNLAYVELCSSPFSLHFGKTASYSFQDWIWDVQALSLQFCSSLLSQQLLSEASLFIVIGFAHNFVQIWKLFSSELLFELHCDDASLLYSISFLFIKNSVPRLIIASGTVFGKIIIWDIKENGKILKILQGHQGGILKLNWSKNQKDLCSASEDRSVRFWKDAISLKSSFFLSESDRLSNEKPLLSFYGHSARVWDCLLLDRFIITSGEDSICCIWDILNTNNNNNNNDKCLAILVGHHGKHIRALSVTDDETILITGGGDSVLKLWGIEDCIQQRGGYEQNFNLPSSNNQLQVKNEDDSIRCLTLNKNSLSLFVATENGFIFELILQSGEWKEIIHFPSKKFYSIFPISFDIIILGDCNGVIDLLGVSPTSPFQHLSITNQSLPICSLFADQQNSNYFFSSSLDGSLCLWSLVDSKVEFLQKFVHGHPKPICCIFTFWNRNILLAGDTHGILYMFQLIQCDSQTNNSFKPFFSVQSHKGKFGDIFVKNNLVFTVGTDGQLRQFKFLETIQEDGTSTIKGLISRTIDKPLKNIDQLEKIYFKDDEIIIMGFLGKDLIIYNVTTSYKLVQIPCGGFRRARDFMFDPVSTKYAFAYTKQKKLFIHTYSPKIQPFYCSSLRMQYHSMTTNCVSFLNQINNFPSLFVTGSEDGTIKILNLNQNQKLSQNRVNLQFTLKGHTSGCRCISFSEFNDAIKYQFLFSGGGKSELKCWKLSLQDSLTAELICETKGEFEVRILSITSFSFRKDLHCIFLGQSDKVLTMWIFDEKNSSFQLIATGNLPSAILSTKLIATTKQNEKFLLCGCTDGSLNWIDLTETLSLFGSLISSPSFSIHSMQKFALNYCNSFQFHLCGLNVIEILKLETKEDFSKWMVITAGDDQKLCVSKFQISTSIIRCISFSSLKPSKNSNFEIAQNAAITAMQTDGKFIFCSGPDQRLNIWQILELNPEPKIEFFSSCYIQVGDVSDLTVQLQHNHYEIILVGSGLQLIEFTPSLKQ